MVIKLQPLAYAYGECTLHVYACLLQTAQPDDFACPSCKCSCSCSIWDSHFSSACASSPGRRLAVSCHTAISLTLCWNCCRPECQGFCLDATIPCLPITTDCAPKKRTWWSIFNVISEIVSLTGVRWTLVLEKVCFLSWNTCKRFNGKPIRWVFAWVLYGTERGRTLGNTGILPHVTTGQHVFVLECFLWCTP